MAGKARRVTWLVSGFDLQLHAFYEAAQGATYRDALCTHSVPLTRLVALDRDAQLSPARCTTCLLVHGDDLADQHGDSPWR